MGSLHPCPTPGCPTLVRSGRCAVHGGERRLWQPRQPVVRIRGAELQRRRAELFAREPWCRPCAQAGRKTVATIRDHIVNLQDGGTEDESNIQPICDVCHEAKTRDEARRGQRRGVGGV